jgi:hypothetical protein
MRNGFLGAIVALAASAGLSWGQFPGGGPPSGVTPVSYGPSPIIPPQMGGYPGYPADPGNAPPNGVSYPPPTNMEAFDPNGVPGNSFHSPEAPCFWLNTEYLMWFQKPGAFGYPLATTGPTSSSGISGVPGTQILYGTRDVAFNMTSGVKISGGLFWDAERRFGLQLDGFLLETRSQPYSLGSNDGGAPLIARPYLDPNLGPGSTVVTAPNIASGGIAISTTSRTWGASGDFIMNLYRSSPTESLGYTLNVLGGIRYLQHQEQVFVQTNTNAFVPSMLNSPGASILFLNQTFTSGFSDVTTTRALNNGVFGQTLVTETISNNSVNLGTIDRFQTRNEFFGADVGLQQEITSGKWSLGLTGRLAFGVMDETVNIFGGSSLTQQSAQMVTTTVTNRQGQIQSQQMANYIISSHYAAVGGVLALGDQIGKYHRDIFTVIPEGVLTLGYQITPAIAFTLGYDALYMPRVIRAGNLITGSVNQGLLPTSPLYGAALSSPVPNVFKESDFWVQGLNIGLRFRY